VGPADNETKAVMSEMKTNKEEADGSKKKAIAVF
jgi:hypothetical protein